MSENSPSPAEQTASQAPSPTSEDLFPPTPPAQVCSFNRCASGHTWALTLRLTPCPACAAPVLAIKMENCPICNEPTSVTELRTDYISSGMKIVGCCQGEISPGEASTITLERPAYPSEPPNV